MFSYFVSRRAPYVKNCSPGLLWYRCSQKFVVANPKYVRAIKGQKTDDKDSVWIADLFKLGIVPSSFIPPKPIRMLRELSHYRFKLIGHRASEKTRLQNALTVSNIALGSVVNDTFGKSSPAIIEYLLYCDTFDPEFCKTLLNKSLKDNADEVIQSINGYELSTDQSTKMKVCRKHFDYINECVDVLDQNIALQSKPYQNLVDLAITVPGIKDQSASFIIAEIGDDMTAFHSSKHLCSWAGLTPQNNESAGKKKSVHVSRAGVSGALIKYCHFLAFFFHTILPFSKNCCKYINH